jgi:hypothetical protein
MREWIRSHLTYANVMVTILAFVVLTGGTAVALNGSNTVQSDDLGPGAQVKAADVADNAVDSADIANGQVKGADVAEGTLGQVPDAAHADNATNLGGSPASDYRLHCPGNLDRAGDLCYEVDLRTAATYQQALKACAVDQRRLPDDGELALVYDHLSASQQYEWAAGHFTSSGASQAPLLGQSSSRDLLTTANPTIAAEPFRCVTSATN